jgi:hypothetical protein
MLLLPRTLGVRAHSGEIINPDEPARGRGFQPVIASLV